MTSNTFNSFLAKILEFLQVNFPELFKINISGRPRQYSFGSIVALMIFYSRNSSFSFRKIVTMLNSDPLSLEILYFQKIPHFTILFKTYKKYIEKKMNIYISRIGISLNKNSSLFYLDSSSLISSKHDNVASLLAMVGIKVRNYIWFVVLVGFLYVFLFPQQMFMILNAIIYWKR